MMQDYWRCRMAIATAGGNEPKVLELSGNMFFGAFAAAMGDLSVVATEIVNWNAQEHIAFARGAARQFGLPWAVDVSPWYGGITDYSTSQYWGNTTSGPHAGHSLSMYNRSWYTTFMSGTGHLVAEAGFVSIKRSFLFLISSHRKCFLLSLSCSKINQMLIKIVSFLSSKNRKSNKKCSSNKNRIKLNNNMQINNNI